MSQSPTAAAGPAFEAAAEVYEQGWSAISRLLRQGYSWSGNERHCAFLNLGTGADRSGGPGFANVSAVSGLDLPGDGRAAARIDWDFDGDLDLVLASRTGPRLRFLGNELRGGGGFLSLRLVGSGTNRDAIGARVEVMLSEAEAPLIATRRAGEGFLAQQSGWLHFGLGDARPSRARVHWPGGSVEVFEGLANDAHFVLEEGRGVARAWAPPRATALAPGGFDPPAPSAAARVVLRAPVPLPELGLLNNRGQRAVLFGVPSRTSTDESAPRPTRPGVTGKPLLLLLWASWCAPCERELRLLAERRAELATAGIDVLALSVDEPEARPAAQVALEELDWPFSVGYAPPDSLDVLDTLQAAVLDRDTRLPLPTSLLIDGEGRLSVLYFGPLDAERLLLDLELLDATPEERRAAAVPFAGRWRTPPREADLASVEARFRRRGQDQTAAEFHLGQVEMRSLSEAEFQHEFGQARLRQQRFEVALEHLRRALEIDPYFFEARRDLAVALHALGRFPEAVAAYREALLLEPESGECLLNLGLALLGAGDRPGAAEQLERLRALETDLRGDLAQRLERKIREADDG